MKTIPLIEAANVIRSKNAGPFELTLDIILKDERTYFHLKELNFFNPELFAKLYGVPASNILKVVWFDPVFAVKCTMIRPIPSGSVGDSDVYGAQQHAPLPGLEIPVPE